MRRIFASAGRKLASRRGETLFEILVAILVASMAIVMLTVSIAVSTRMNREANAEAESDRLNEYVTDASGALIGEPGEAVVRREGYIADIYNIKINIYSSQNGRYEIYGLDPSAETVAAPETVTPPGEGD